MKCAVIGRFKSFFTMSFALVLPVNSCKKKALAVKQMTYHSQKTCHAVQKERMLYVMLDRSIFKMLISQQAAWKNYAF